MKVGGGRGVLTTPAEGPAPPQPETTAHPAPPPLVPRANGPVEGVIRPRNEGGSGSEGELDADVVPRPGAVSRPTSRPARPPSPPRSTAPAHCRLGAGIGRDRPGRRRATARRPPRRKVATATVVCPGRGRRAPRHRPRRPPPTPAPPDRDRCPGPLPRPGHRPRQFSRWRPRRPSAPWSGAGGAPDRLRCRPRPRRRRRPRPRTRRARSR